MNLTFGQLVTQARERRGLLSKSLATLLNRDPSFVSRLETDQFKNPPTPDVVCGLVEVLGLSEVELVRALGYLSTVPKGEEGVLGHPFSQDDPRSAIVTMLSQVPDQLIPLATELVRTVRDSDAAGRMRVPEDDPAYPPETELAPKRKLNTSSANVVARQGKRRGSPAVSVTMSDSPSS